MIRINLLPQARKTTAVRAAPSAAGASQAWPVVYFVAILLWLGMLGVVYFLALADLDEQEASNADLSRQIQTARGQGEGLETCRAELAKKHQLEQVVGELQRKRSGPTRVLMELSRILSVGGGPTIDAERLEALRRDNPLAGFNRGWDTRRLWLNSFVEDTHECTMHGFGKSNEDVAEFLRRLALSESFEDVTLTKTESEIDPATNLPLIQFELTCKVRY